MKISLEFIKLKTLSMQKKYKIFLLCSCLWLHSCNLDNGTFPENFLTCEINNVFWDSLFVNAEITDNNGIFLISIEASNADLETLYINLQGTSVQRFFNLNSSGTNQVVYSPSGLVFNPGNLDSSDCFPNIGEVRITEHDAVNRTISGEFRAAVCDLGGANQVGITNGSFNKVSY